MGGGSAWRCPLVAVPCPQAHAKPKDVARFDCDLGGGTAWGGEQQLEAVGWGGLCTQPGHGSPGQSPQIRGARRKATSPPTLTPAVALGAS